MLITGMGKLEDVMRVSRHAIKRWKEFVCHTMTPRQIVNRIKNICKVTDPVRMGDHTRHSDGWVTVVVKNDTAVTLWGKPYVKGNYKHRRR